MENAETKFIDMTPSWEEILPLLVNAIQHGDAKAYGVAWEELRRMAQLADIGAQAVQWQQDAIKNGAVMKWNGFDVVR